MLAENYSPLESDQGGVCFSKDKLLEKKEVLAAFE
jgi:hypothetical protein